MNPGYSHILLVTVSGVEFNLRLEPLTGQFTDGETEAKRAHGLFQATEQARSPWDTSTQHGAAAGQQMAPRSSPSKAQGKVT